MSWAPPPPTHSFFARRARAAGDASPTHGHAKHPRAGVWSRPDSSSCPRSARNAAFALYLAYNARMAGPARGGAPPRRALFRSTNTTPRTDAVLQGARGVHLYLHVPARPENFQALARDLDSKETSDSCVFEFLSRSLLLSGPQGFGSDLRRQPPPARGARGESSRDVGAQQGGRRGNERVLPPRGTVPAGGKVVRSILCRRPASISAQRTRRFRLVL